MAMFTDKRIAFCNVNQSKWYKMKDATEENFVQIRKWIPIISAPDTESFYRSVMICNSVTDIFGCPLQQYVFLQRPHKPHCQSHDDPDKD